MEFYLDKFANKQATSIAIQAAIQAAMGAKAPPTCSRRRLSEISAKWDKDCKAATDCIPLLSSIEDSWVDLVDLVEPGTSIEVVAGTIKWTSRDVYIHFVDGSRSITNFGKFRSTVALRSTGLVSVMCKALTPVYGQRLNASGGSSYTHPHISGTTPCLGNASLEIASMAKDSNAAGVISTLTNFLQSYCSKDPYYALCNWEVASRGNMTTCSTCHIPYSGRRCSACRTCIGCNSVQGGGRAHRAVPGSVNRYVCKSCAKNTLKVCPTHKLKSAGILRSGWVHRWQFPENSDVAIPFSSEVEV